MIKAAILTIAAMASTMAHAQPIIGNGISSSLKSEIISTYKLLPLKVDDSTVLYNVAFRENQLVFYYSLQVKRYQLWDMYTDLKELTVKTNCANPTIREYLKEIKGVRHEFNDSDRLKGVHVVVTLQDCQKGPQT